MQKAQSLLQFQIFIIRNFIRFRLGIPEPMFTCNEHKLQGYAIRLKVQTNRAIEREKNMRRPHIPPVCVMLMLMSKVKDTQTATTTKIVYK